jgi:SAM-dependent methyltransferase
VTKAQNSWQDAGGQRWAELSARTDAQLGPLGRKVMALLEPARGERVLDIGCGAGQSTAELAELVGETGRVVGVDISEPLLNAAKDRIAARGLRQVELVLGDAANVTFAQPFDLAFSRFGVMFFEDSVAAFENVGRALRAGGRLGFVCWQPQERNPWADAPLAAVRTLRPDLPLPPLVAPDLPGPFYFSSPPFVRDILERAGFVDVRIEPYEESLPLGGAKLLDEAVEYLLQIGPAARFLSEAGLNADARARELIARALAPFVTDGGVLVPARVLLVTARRR